MSLSSGDGCLWQSTSGRKHEAAGVPGLAVICSSIPAVLGPNSAGADDRVDPGGNDAQRYPPRGPRGGSRKSEDGG